MSYRRDILWGGWEGYINNKLDNFIEFGIELGLFLWEFDGFWGEFDFKKRIKIRKIYLKRRRFFSRFKNWKIRPKWLWSRKSLIRKYYGNCKNLGFYSSYWKTSNKFFRIRMWIWYRGF
jgi:hypothetical protein